MTRQEEGVPSSSESGYGPQGTARPPRIDAGTAHTGHVIERAFVYQIHSVTKQILKIEELELATGMRRELPIPYGQEYAPYGDQAYAPYGDQADDQGYQTYDADPPRDFQPPAYPGYYPPRPPYPGYPGYHPPRPPYPGYPGYHPPRPVYPGYPGYHPPRPVYPGYPGYPGYHPPRPPYPGYPGYHRPG